MNRGRIISFPRRVLFILILFSLLGCQPETGKLNAVSATTGPLTSLLGSREYLVHQQIAIVNDGAGVPEKQNIWVALISDFPPYQEVLSMQVLPNRYQLVVDENGNHYAEFDFSGQRAGKTQLVKIDYRVAVNELTYDLSTCQGELPDEFTQPELHIESANPQIVNLAKQISQGKASVCQKVRAFYDYIDEHLTYTSNGENWGAQAALGKMGSDCTEYTDLLVALSRSQGIPARYFEGLLYTEENASDSVKIEHAWPDVYLPEVGWAALDPTLGRLPANHETYYAHYTPNHIIVTLGASPSVLRDSSYWTHLYWPGDSTTIHVDGKWQVELAEPDGH